MQFIFIINDFQFGSNTLLAEETLEILLDKGVWVFNSNTPNFSKIKVNDRVIIYIAGKNRRYFVGEFTIASEMFHHENEGLFTDKEKFLFRMFNYSVEIKNIRMFEKPISILSIKDDLEFIKDKKNYGLFFRQATKLISEKDYYFIVNQLVNQ